MMSNMALRKILFHLSISLSPFLPQGGRTPLLWASLYGQSDTVRTLIELGANVHSTDTASIFIVFLFFFLFLFFFFFCCCCFVFCVMFVFILDANNTTVYIDYINNGFPSRHTSYSNLPVSLFPLKL